MKRKVGIEKETRRNVNYKRAFTDGRCPVPRNTETGIAEVNHSDTCCAISIPFKLCSSKDAFRFICASVFQVACFHETLKSDMNFIFRSYAPVTNEDKKYTSTHTTLLVNYKESPIETLSFLLWFCFCLRSVKEIRLAISRNISKRFVGFQQYRLVSLENTKFENESVNYNGVFRNTIHRLCHGVHYFQNVTRMHSTHVKQHSTTCAQKESRTFSAESFVKSQMLNCIICGFLILNSSKCGT